MALSKLMGISQLEVESQIWTSLAWDPQFCTRACVFVAFSKDTTSAMTASLGELQVLAIVGLGCMQYWESGERQVCV